MQFTVAAGVWQIGDVTNAAATFLTATDQITLTGTAGPGTGSRIDLIVVKQNNIENGDADSRSNVSLVTGVAGSPGVQPATPVGASLIAYIFVPAGAANAALCTVVYWSPTVVAAPVRIAQTLAQLNATHILVLVNGAQARVVADGNNNGDYIWFGPTWVRSYSGATFPVVPSSVVGTTVTASASGKVSFTAASGLNINGCFLTSAGKVDILIDISGMSTPGQLMMNLRSGGADIASANYDWEITYGSGATSPATGGTAVTAWQLTAGATGSHSLRLTIFNPNQGDLKRMIGQSIDYSGGAAPVLTNIAAGFRLTSLCDGFSLYAPGGGTFGGSISVEAHVN